MSNNPGPQLAPPSTLCHAHGPRPDQPCFKPICRHPRPVLNWLELISTTLLSEINRPEGDYIKTDTSAFFPPVDSTHTGSTNYLEFRPTSKAVKNSLGSQVIAPSPCINNACLPPLTSKQCYSVITGGITPEDTMGPHPVPQFGWKQRHCSCNGVKGRSSMLTRSCLIVAMQLTAAENRSSLTAPTQLTAAILRSSLTVALSQPGQRMGVPCLQGTCWNFTAG